MNEKDLKLAEDIESGKIKSIRTDGQDVQDGTRQRFNFVADIKAEGGVLVLYTSEEAKKIDERKYRDRLIDLDRAVDMYRNIGQLMIKMSRQGFVNMDELRDVLDAYGRKIIEAMGQCRSMNLPISEKVLNFENAFHLYHQSLLALADIPDMKLSKNDKEGGTQDSGSNGVKK